MNDILNTPSYLFVISVTGSILVALIILATMTLYNAIIVEFKLLEFKVKKESEKAKKELLERKDKMNRKSYLSYLKYKKYDPERINQRYNSRIVDLNKDHLCNMNLIMLQLIKSPTIYCHLYGYCMCLSNFRLIIDSEMEFDSTCIAEKDWSMILESLLSNAIIYRESRKANIICLYMSERAKSYYFEIKSFNRVDKRIYDENHERHDTGRISILSINGILDKYKNIHHTTHISQGEYIFKQALLLIED